MAWVSVIIPVFNSERHVIRCIESIQNQTVKDIEIIVVDDSSTDNSRNLVKWKAKQDERITLISLDIRSGPGGARNAAIRKADSPYILGIDSDDYADPDMLEKSLFEAEQKKSDVTVFGYREVTSSGKVLSEITPSSRSHHRKRRRSSIMMSTNTGFCNKLWRSSLLKDQGIEFPTGMYFEDLATIPRLLIKSRKISYIDDCLYNYRINPNSITNTSSPKHIFDLFYAFIILSSFLVEQNQWQLHGRDCVDMVSRAMRRHAKLIGRLPMTDCEKRNQLRQLVLLREAIAKKGRNIMSLDEADLLNKAKRRYSSWLGIG